jgi:hypothetical protein
MRCVGGAATGDHPFKILEDHPAFREFLLNDPIKKSPK